MEHSLRGQIPHVSPMRLGSRGRRFSRMGSRNRRPIAEGGARPRPVVHALARLVLRWSWRASVSREFWHHPFPDDIPVGHGHGHPLGLGQRPRTVLLLGGRLVSGAGVRSHQLSLAGHLARETAWLTGQDVDVHVVAGVDTPDVIRLARVSASRPYDAVIVL